DRYPSPISGRSESKPPKCVPFHWCDGASCKRRAHRMLPLGRGDRRRLRPGLPGPHHAGAGRGQQVQRGRPVLRRLRVVLFRHGGAQRGYQQVHSSRRVNAFRRRHHGSGGCFDPERPARLGVFGGKPGRFRRQCQVGQRRPLGKHGWL
ncbi:MAG: hypothetical protein AVDCRST_MAG83-3191, partial [uncultured Arthrobacter sp.]